MPFEAFHLAEHQSFSMRLARSEWKINAWHSNEYKAGIVWSKMKTKPTKYEREREIYRKASKQASLVAKVYTLNVEKIHAQTVR